MGELSGTDQAFEAQRKPRTHEEILAQQQKLIPIVDQLIAQGNVRDAKPITLAGVKSGYGLQVQIGMRELQDDAKVLGLFEDRTGIAAPDRPDFDPIGQLVIEQDPFDSEIYQCFESNEFINRQDYQTPEAHPQDIHFNALAGKRDYDGLSVGFSEGYWYKRNNVIERNQLKGFTYKDRPNLLTRKLHQRQGLGTVLLDTAIALSIKEGKSNFKLMGCSEGTQRLVARSGYAYSEEKIPLPNGEFGVNLVIPLDKYN